MDDDSKTIPLTTVASYALWLTVGTALIAAWICLAVGHENVAFMLGINTGVLTGIAVLFALRGHANRTRALLRTLHGLDRLPADAELHSLR